MRVFDTRIFAFNVGTSYRIRQKLPILDTLQLGLSLLFSPFWGNMQTKSLCSTAFKFAKLLEILNEKGATKFAANAHILAVQVAMGNAPLPMTGIDFTKDDVISNGPTPINTFDGSGEKKNVVVPQIPEQKKVGVVCPKSLVHFI